MRWSLIDWPWAKPKDELAPETSVEEAEKNAANIPKDGVDSDKVARSTTIKPKVSEK